MKFKTLDELCDKVIDCPHSTPDWKREGIRVIRNFNLNDGRLDFSDSYFVDEETYNKRVARGIPEAEDIVFSREAPMGKVAIVPPNLKCCLGQRLVLLKVNRKICDPYYLLFMMMSDYVQKQISGTSGSIVSNIDIPDLKALLIPYYDMETQNRIAKILRDITDKIVYNERINDNLAVQSNMVA